MNVDKVIAAIPNQTPAGRKIMRDRAEEWFESGDPAKAEPARLVFEALTRHAADEHAALYAALSGADASQRVVAAFKAAPMTATDERVVQALFDNPGANSAELSAACGWRPGAGWHMHFGKMCARRADWLWPAPYAEKRDAEFYCGILCEWSWHTGKLTYTLRPEVVEAFAAMGLKPRARAA